MTRPDTFNYVPACRRDFQVEILRTRKHVYACSHVHRMLQLEDLHNQRLRKGIKRPAVSADRLSHSYNI